MVLLPTGQDQIQHRAQAKLPVEMPWIPQRWESSEFHLQLSVSTKAFLGIDRGGAAVHWDPLQWSSPSCLQWLLAENVSKHLDRSLEPKEDGWGAAVLAVLKRCKEICEHCWAPAPHCTSSLILFPLVWEGAESVNSSLPGLNPGTAYNHLANITALGAEIFSILK